MIAHVVPDKVPAALAKIGVRAGDTILRDAGSTRIRIHRSIENVPKAALDALDGVYTCTPERLAGAALLAGWTPERIAKAGIRK
jgi:hypothetical protein